MSGLTQVGLGYTACDNNTWTLPTFICSGMLSTLFKKVNGKTYLMNLIKSRGTKYLIVSQSKGPDESIRLIRGSTHPRSSVTSYI